MVKFYIFRVSLCFKLTDGSEHTATAKVGDNLLDIIIDNDIDVDGFGLYIILLYMLYSQIHVIIYCLKT